MPVDVHDIIKRALLFGLQPPCGTKWDDSMKTTSGTGLDLILSNYM